MPAEFDAAYTTDMLVNTIERKRIKTVPLLSLTVIGKVIIYEYLHSITGLGY